MKLHFVGIGGSGMSPLAQYKLHQGDQVSGSDRSFDHNQNLTILRKLSALGVKIYPQDGSGVDQSVDRVIASNAVESNIPDMERANQLKIPISTRAQLLAEIANSRKTIAIAGTSGKTTTTGMLSVILVDQGLEPYVICGGIIKNFQTSENIGDFYSGKGDLLIIEADESDGSIVNYQPQIGVILNISPDHKEIEELRRYFTIFGQNCQQKLLISSDCNETISLKLPQEKIKSFGFKEGSNYKIENAVQWDLGWSFFVNGQEFYLPLPGKHNILNATAAIAIAHMLGLPLEKIANSLSKFQGIKRRLELVAKVNEITVIDDFAHNPAKIKASLETLRFLAKRLLVIFQLHGYGPAKLMRRDLIRVLSEELRDQDILFMPEIYYAGGSVVKDISALDIVKELKIRKVKAEFFPQRSEIINAVSNIASEGDIILIMGARDNTLSDFAEEIVKKLNSIG